MIIQENDNKVLIDLRDYTKITKHIGVKFDANTYRTHIKKGTMLQGVIADGKYAVWVDTSIYNAVFRKNKGCSNCEELRSTLKNINKLSS